MSVSILTPQDIANVAAVAAVVVPPVVSLLKQENWSTDVKQAIAFIVSGAVAVGVLFAGHAISGASFINTATIIQTIAIVYTASQIVYRGFAGSKPEVWLTRLPHKASPPPAPDPEPVPAAPVAAEPEVAV